MIKLVCPDCGSEEILNVDDIGSSNTFECQSCLIKFKIQESDWNYA